MAPCTVADVVATYGGTQGVNSTMTQLSLGFWLRGATACWVSGPPVVELLGSGGAVVQPAVQGRNLATFRQGRVLVAAPLGPGQGSALRPGEAVVMVDFRPPGGGGVPCPGPSTVEGIAVHLAPAHAGLVVQLPRSVLLCATYVGNSQLFAPEPATQKAPLALSARIEAPSEVRAGARLRYEVFLTNTGYEVIRFSDYCPNYREDLQPIGAGKLRFQLNCAVLREIAAGDTRRLEMVMDVPERLPAGRYDLIWALDPSVSDASATVPIHLVSA